MGKLLNIAVSGYFEFPKCSCDFVSYVFWIEILNSKFIMTSAALEGGKSALSLEIETRIVILLKPGSCLARSTREQIVKKTKTNTAHLKPRSWLRSRSKARPKKS